MPERFEGAKSENANKLITFGMGRRQCPGIALANKVVGPEANLNIKLCTAEPTPPPEFFGETTSFATPVAAP
ncbi:hypothetical protein AgCh_037246 [Apium graveolens]